MSFSADIQWACSFPWVKGSHDSNLDCFPQRRQVMKVSWRQTASKDHIATEIKHIPEFERVWKDLDPDWLMVVTWTLKDDYLLNVSVCTI